ncbi:hypothetical protein [Chromobacterium sp. Beijing]|uniref:hypothetical protein n=1 Tax=Chromobacterium sp. Beijing TaxID=2735795 RepID=UPI001F3D322D|nr:hypothetical protein [Chromobacterium sp. Beijing]
MLNLALLRDPALAAGLLGNALVSTVMMATLVVGPFYLARGWAWTPPASAWRCRWGRWWRP